MGIKHSSAQPQGKHNRDLDLITHQRTSCPMPRRDVQNPHPVFPGGIIN